MVLPSAYSLPVTSQSWPSFAASDPNCSSSGDPGYKALNASPSQVQSSGHSSSRSSPGSCTLSHAGMWLLIKRICRPLNS